MLDPYSLVEGVVSSITPLTTFSKDSPATGEFMSIDDLQTHLIWGRRLLQLCKYLITSHQIYRKQLIIDLGKRWPYPALILPKYGLARADPDRVLTSRIFLWSDWSKQSNCCNSRLTVLAFHGYAKEIPDPCYKLFMLRVSLDVWTLPIFQRQNYQYLRANKTLPLKLLFLAWIPRRR